MTVTRLERKTLKSRVKSRLRKQLLKLGTDQSIRDLSVKQSKQLVKNNEVLKELKKDL